MLVSSADWLACVDFGEALPEGDCYLGFDAGGSRWPWGPLCGTKSAGGDADSARPADQAPLLHIDMRFGVGAGWRSRAGDRQRAYRRRRPWSPVGSGRPWWPSVRREDMKKLLIVHPPEHAATHRPYPPATVKNYMEIPPFGGWFNCLGHVLPSLCTCSFWFVPSCDVLSTPAGYRVQLWIMWSTVPLPSYLHSCSLPDEA